MGQGCGRSGVSTDEVRNLHNGVEAEEGASYGIRRGLALYMVRRRGCALDRSAGMVSDEQAEGFTTENVHSHLEDSETS